MARLDVTCRSSAPVERAGWRSECSTNDEPVHLRLGESGEEGKDMVVVVDDDDDVEFSSGPTRLSTSG